MDASEIKKKLNKEIIIFPSHNSFPPKPENIFLKSDVNIISDVEISAESSVWYNTVIRGYVNYIRIGSIKNILK